VTKNFRQPLKVKRSIVKVSRDTTPSDATPVDPALSTCTRHLQPVGDLGLYVVCLVAVRRFQPALLLLHKHLITVVEIVRD